MTREEILRYKKQISLPAIGLEGQKKICSAKVLVIGAGGLGSPILLYLTAAGVGTIACMDFDCVEIHNLHRQVVHSEQSIGSYKVESASLRLRSLSSAVHYIPIPERATAATVNDYISEYDIVVDGCDNFETRYLINDACLSQQKPLVYGSILNFELQMAVFNYQGSKDLRAIFPEPPHPDDVPSCDLNGVMGTTPGILGLMMAQETLKVIVGLPTLRNAWLIVDTLTWAIRKIRF
ncbi:HesA/MoeB/ThiF family protein [Sphingobacterium psychroaquaticum]|uniref:HesA/MoeB/ThiF family protein n=1 Tax=Sphingobacterium psychroaquaticum TaxID=561061 RepID=UPI00106C8786|nr:HesA/MoeB/ThiF family protein [Sphingobacterium psychroaquaticum]QBQ41159.1 HesA/MoeB/ThiF family protein [Sphingobacterium psychroaquaticum]